VRLKCAPFGLASFLLGGREEDEDYQFFLDVAEVMFAFGLDKNHCAGPNLGLFGADLHAASSTDDVVKLVFMVRLLRISGANGENIDAGAKRPNTEKLQIEFAFGRALAIQFIDMEEVSQIRDGKPGIGNETFIPQLR
jgi:hypothetical protein